MRGLRLAIPLRQPTEIDRRAERGDIRGMAMTWEEWKEAVDVWLFRYLDLTSDDLPDWSYRDAFDQGMSPADAAKEAVQAAKSA
jgi:hypothetical protein